jgi:hypothetical protein
MRPSTVFIIGTLAVAATAALSGAAQVSTSADTKQLSAQQVPESPAGSVISAQLRWGRAAAEANSPEVLDALTPLFEQKSQRLNFAKRDLLSLLEEAMPRKLGRIFPFRRPHPFADNLVFENFGHRGFLIGEIDQRVPPILSGTETAEWLELRGPSPLVTAREFSPALHPIQGMRALGLQKPWATEIFSTAWVPFFDAASAVVENGGLRCWNKNLPQKTISNLAEPASHFRCSTPMSLRTQEAALPKQLPNKIGARAAAQAAALNPPSPAPACIPMGRLQLQSLELFGDDKAAHCVLWRNSLDERFIQKEMTSELICLNARHKSFQKTRFNSVVAVIPSSKADVIHIIESEDGLLTSHRMNMATLTATKEEITVPTGQNLRNASFPKQRTGLFACKQTGLTIPASAAAFEGPSADADWLYIDDAIYGGLRPNRSETDIAWRIRESAGGQPEVERLSWSQLQYDHPSITNERPFACVAAREVDSRCGLRVLQTAMQLSEEWLNGDFEKHQISPAIQLVISMVVGQSLEKVIRALPDWSLRAESEELFKIYAEKAMQLSRDKTSVRLGIKLDQPSPKFPAAHRYLDVPADSQDYNAVKKLLSSSTDFWALIRHKSL